jgi:putrescine aminotransferase
MMNDSTPNTTRQWQELDRAHHVHPFTDPKIYETRAVKVITKADGVYIWDSEGNKILDGMAGLWCVNVGYGRHELVEAATRQLESLPYYNTFWNTSTPSQIELGHRLAAIVPEGIRHFFYANSGSEANDTIIRLVRHYWEVAGQPTRQVFIGRTLGYHGSTLAATSLGGMPHMHKLGKSLLPGFEHIEHPHWYTQGGTLSREEFGLVAARRLEEKILAIGADNVAAFVGEPVQGAGGVFEPPPSYWEEIQRICRKYDVLLVADEVICGFGRTGEWFGSQLYHIQPDLVTMAKGLSSGYMPISAVGMSEKFYRTLTLGGVLTHGYTYSGHPVACAVACANLDLMHRERIVERVREDAAPYFRQRLQALADSHPIVGELRGAGLIAGLQLVRDRATRQVFTTEDDAAIKCREHALNHNLIMRAVGQSMVLSPPLVISHAEIDELVDKAKVALDLTAREFGIST